MGFGVWGLGLGAWGLGLGAWGLGLGAWGLGLGVWGLGFGVWGLAFGVWGLEFRISGLGPNKQPHNLPFSGRAARWAICLQAPSFALKRLCGRRRTYMGCFRIRGYLRGVLLRSESYYWGVYVRGSLIVATPHMAFIASVWMAKGLCARKPPPQAINLCLR